MSTWTLHDLEIFRAAVESVPWDALMEETLLPTGVNPGEYVRWPDFTRDMSLAGRQRLKELEELLGE